MESSTQGALIMSMKPKGDMVQEVLVDAEVNEAVQFLDRNIFDLDLILALAELRELVIWQKASTIVSSESTQKLGRIAQLMAHLTPEQREMVTNGTVITEQLRDLLYIEALQAANNVT